MAKASSFSQERLSRWDWAVSQISSTTFESTETDETSLTGLVEYWLSTFLASR